jgi:hypothetical protein
MRTKRSLLLLSAAFALPALPTRADNLLIWTPVKLSDNSYKATMGFRLPAEWETSAGADIALASTGGGELMQNSEQAALWGSLSKVSVTPASRIEQTSSVRVDTLRGDASLTLSHARSWIVTDWLDAQSTRSVMVRYDTIDSRQASMDASQSLKLTHPWTGTSLLAEASFDNASGSLSNSVAMNQVILPDLSLNATINDPASSKRTGSVRVNYQVRW